MAHLGKVLDPVMNEYWATNNARSGKNFGYDEQIQVQFSFPFSFFSLLDQ
jgi:hypothetical protein